MSIIFGGRRSAPSTTQMDTRPETVIGPATTLRGDLTVEGALRIDGQIEGSVTASGNVIVGKTARVTAAISGHNILVAGVVQGAITATGRLEIIATGRVLGDINVQALLIEEGGVLRGQSIMRDTAEIEVLPAPPPADPATDPATALA